MPGFPESIVERRLLEVLDRLIIDEPVIALHGPRAVGKSTLLRAFAAASDVAVLDLDDPATLEAVQANTAAAAGGPSPLCVDEYQKALDILDAIKARLNREGAQPGTAVLTGSTRHDELSDPTLSLEELIWRLFHEEREVRVDKGAALRRGCRCTIAHYEKVLARFPETDLADMRDERGKIVVDCAFCSRLFEIDL